MEFKISIIIPVFNRSNLILDTLESIEFQTYGNWECLIIDDGSLDSTYSIISSFIKNKPKFSLYHRPAFLPKGAPSCRNLGFELSKGDFIQWFDSDDIMLPTMLEEKVSALLLKPEVEFVVAKMDDLIDGEIKRIEYNLKSDDLIFDYIRNRIYFFTPGPLFRRSFLRNKELFNINFKRHQESEFYFRLLLCRPEFIVLNRSLALRRIHSSSIKSNVSDKDEKYYFYILLVSYLKSMLTMDLIVWDRKLFIHFMKWSRSSVKFFFKYIDLSFLFLGFQLLIYSIFINWKSKFQ